MPKLRLNEIRKDFDIMARPVNESNAHEYIDALAAGAEFPPLIIDRNTKTLVGGYHRYYALERYYGKEYEVAVEYIECENKKEMLLAAGRDNKQNGFHMDPDDSKSFAIRARYLGASKEEILSALGISEQRYETWSLDTVVVRGNGKKAPAPTTPKHPIAPEQFDDLDFGMTVIELALELIKQLENDAVHHDNDLEVAALRKLNLRLIRYLNEIAKSAAV